VLPRRLVLLVSNSLSFLSIPDRLLRKLVHRPFLAEAREGPPFEIKEIVGKGMGAVAIRDIKAGELILSETPLVIWADEEDLDQLEKKLESLPDPERKNFYASYIASAYRDLPPSRGIFRTHAHPLYADGSGFFDQGNRFRHSCRPNCTSHWDEEQGVRWSIANREIRQGEEICMSHGESRAPRLERQAWLKAKFDVICGCEACSYDKHRAAESDGRRGVIRQIYDSIERLYLDPLELIKEVNIALKLLEEEGLAVGALDLAYEALIVCIWYGDRLNASLWLDKTQELQAKEAGIWSTRYKELERLEGDPTRHFAWEDLCRRLGFQTKALYGPEGRKRSVRR